MQQRTDPKTWIEIEEIDYEVDQFPDGSFRFRCDFRYFDNPLTEFNVTLKTTLPEAIIALYQVCSSLEYFYSSPIILHIQTMPDQRADRIENKGDSVPAEVTAALIAGLPSVSNVVVYDPHSPVCIKTMRTMNGQDFVQVVEPIECFIEALYADCNNDHVIDTVVAVDRGAIHRAKQVHDHFGASIIYADKQRVDGRVIGHAISHVEGDILPEGTIWVVDDLCDGGATFISIAKIIKAQYPDAELNLYVTHGLFSRGKEELQKYYTHILSLFDYSQGN